MDRVYNVLNLGAGVQSSRVLLASCLGQLPKFDAAVFADTQWEPAAVYENVRFLQAEGEKAGIPVHVVTRGNLRRDAIEFRRLPKSADGKRYASIPTFIKNPDGSQGRVKRQCTKEYKIEVVDTWLRRVLLGLAPHKRVPKGVTIRTWFGISDDEASRATFPGRMKEITVPVGTNLLGEAETRKGKRWVPMKWRQHVYPLLNEVWRPDRTILEEQLLPRREQRQDCQEWLQQHFPGRKFPRSACIGCPFRSNVEWIEMRDERPAEWEDACNFDEEMREKDGEGQMLRWKGQLVGLPFVHRQLVPLRMANLEGDGEKGGGCGTLLDGLDGLCGV